MALLKCAGAPRPSLAAPHQDELAVLNDFEDELNRLSAENQQLLDEFQNADDAQANCAIDQAAFLAPAHGEELDVLRLENAELRARVQELEALGTGQSEDAWLERQREYEMLLEEKSEVIRGLHQKMQEMQEAQESAIGGDTPVQPCPGGSSTRLGQAEEILRLKRELEEQRKQLEQDEEDMMAQMREMELSMAKERAEMARQRQEVQRLQSDLNREIEQSGRDPELKERLNNLRQARPKSAAEHPARAADQQKSSGFFRRIFG